MASPAWPSRLRAVAAAAARSVVVRSGAPPELPAVLGWAKAASVAVKSAGLPALLSAAGPVTTSGKTLETIGVLIVDGSVDG